MSDLPELDFDSETFANDLLVNLLLDEYYKIGDRLAENDTTTTVGREDHHYDCKLSKAFRRVLRYYLSASDQKRYGVEK